MCSWCTWIPIFEKKLKDSDIRHANNLYGCALIQASPIAEYEDVIVFLEVKHAAEDDSEMGCF